MFKTFRKLAKRFQDLPERDFVDGRTKEQSLRHIQAVESGQEQELRSLYRYLYVHDPDIRTAAAKALQTQGCEPRDEADKSLMLLAVKAWSELAGLDPERLVRAWEAEYSLAPGSYWTAVVLAALAQIQDRHNLLSLAADRELSQNTRVVLLWAAGVRGENEPADLADVYTSEPNQYVQQGVVQALRFVGAGSGPHLADLLARERDEDLCRELSLALAGLGSHATAHLEPLLDSQQRLVREYAGLALLGTADPQALNTLSRIKESSRDGRLKSLINEFMIGMQADVSSWRELSSPEADGGFLDSQRLASCAAGQDNEQLLPFVLTMLANRPGQEGVSVLKDHLLAPRADHLGMEAGLALATLSDLPQAREVLQKALIKGNNQVRTVACLALLLARIPCMPLLARS